MPLFSVLISLFFVGTAATIAFACGYTKHSSVCLSQELDKYEYREDFEKVLKEYQNWIEYSFNEEIVTGLDQVGVSLPNSIKEKLINDLTKKCMDYNSSDDTFTADNDQEYDAHMEGVDAFLEDPETMEYINMVLEDSGVLEDGDEFVPGSLCESKESDKDLSVEEMETLCKLLNRYKQQVLYACDKCDEEGTNNIDEYLPDAEKAEFIAGACEEIVNIYGY